MCRIPNAVGFKPQRRLTYCTIERKSIVVFNAITVMNRNKPLSSELHQKLLRMSVYPYVNTELVQTHNYESEMNLVLYDKGIFLH